MPQIFSDAVSKYQENHGPRKMRKLFAPFVIMSVFLLSAGCSAERDNAPRVDPELAYSLVKEIYAFGPRPSGSMKLHEQSVFIAEKAKEFGADNVDVQMFTDKTPEGNIKFRNVTAEIKGTKEQFLVIGCHYDTKKFISLPSFAGANDGASGAGLLLAMIKALKSSGEKPYYTLRIVFFDGEECLLNYSGHDGLHGSRHYVKELKKSGELKKCRAALILDMVGDKDLSITLPSDSDHKIASEIFRIARKQNKAKYFSWFRGSMLDDHTPFIKEGIAAVDIIDFEYGSSNKYWHTSGDTMDKISRESLETVGNLTLQLIWNRF